MSFALGLSWLDGVTHRVDWLYVRPPGRRSFMSCGKNPPHDKFQGAEERSSSLTHEPRLFAVAERPIGFLPPIRRRLPKNSPASDYSPFVVELFTVDDLRPSPNLVTGPVPSVTRQKLPTPAHVERTHRVGREPRGRIWKN